MTRNVDVAEDLCQDSLLQIHKKLHNYKGQSRLSTWIFRVTSNTVLMHFRLLKKRLDTISIDENAERAIPDEKIGGITFIDPFQSLALKEAVGNLPRGYRNTLILHDYFGFEHREVGELIGVSDGTCKSQLFKARKAAQKQLNKKRNPRVYEPRN
jgi:RNA polymerase sigma-70 factor (ECF subfamily)